MKKDCYVPSGELQGDDRGMPNRGSGTGVTDTYGADVSQGATNRQGSIRSATRSDSAFDNDVDPAGSKDGDES